MRTDVTPVHAISAQVDSLRHPPADEPSSSFAAVAQRQLDIGARLRHKPPPPLATGAD